MAAKRLAFSKQCFNILGEQGRALINVHMKFPNSIVYPPNMDNLQVIARGEEQKRYE